MSRGRDAGGHWGFKNPCHSPAVGQRVWPHLRVTDNTLPVCMCTCMLPHVLIPACSHLPANHHAHVCVCQPRAHAPSQAQACACTDCTHTLNSPIPAHHKMPGVHTGRCLNPACRAPGRSPGGTCGWLWHALTFVVGLLSCFAEWSVASSSQGRQVNIQGTGGRPPGQVTCRGVCTRSALPFPCAVPMKHAIQTKHM